MIHPESFIGNSTPAVVAIAFNPIGGSYSGSDMSVTVTITGATRFFYSVNHGTKAYKTGTIESPSGVVAFANSYNGRDLNIEARAPDETLLDFSFQTYTRV